MQSFLSVNGECVTEKVIEKSRFIATSRHVDGEEEARAFVDEIRARYKDATHNCYAYVADDKGNFLRFSDDGEPQGTAGMPILEVIKNCNLKQTAVVVTRYFGGIKLGAGGLVRAYAGAAAENLAAVERVNYEPCVKYAYTVDYPLTDAALRFFEASDCSVTDTVYADKVTFTVAIKKSAEEQFNSLLKDRLCGKVETQKLDEYTFPFKI